MTIARRNILGLIAASAATALPGCGGGGGGPSSRLVRVLNLNPEFPSAQVEIRNTVVAPLLSFREMTQPIEVAFGSYTLTVRDRASARSESFDNIPADENSASVEVFYRSFNSVGLQGLLETSPPLVINLFDVNEHLIVDLDDGLGIVQTKELAFQGSVAQASLSPQCRLRVYRSSNGALVYDSGTPFRPRPRAILLFPLFAGFPFDPIFGRVSVMALNYSGAYASAEEWPTS